MTAPRSVYCRLILVLAVLAVFGRLLLCDFTWWDDPHTVHQNPHLNPVTWSGVWFNWTTPQASIYIPLTYTVWAGVALIARVNPDPDGISLNPLFFHAASLLIHAGGALAAWGLLRRLVKSDLAALLGALLWAVHPVQVESLGWISGLKDVLSGTLALAALLAYVRFRESGRRAWFGVSLGVYALALLAKPSAFTLPLLIVTLDRLAFAVPWRKIAWAMIPFAAATLPIAIVARAVQQAPAAQAPAWVRGFLVGDALSFYALKVIAPIHLAFDYARDIPSVRASPTFYVAWLLPVTVAAALAFAYRRARRAGRPMTPWWAVGTLWFVFAPFHVLGFTRFDFQTISTVADHYMYVAMIGPALLLAAAVARWPRGAGVAAVVVAVYGARAAWQTPVWQDDWHLLNHNLAVSPRSWTSHLNLGVMYNRRFEFETEEWHLKQAMAINPNSPSVALNLLAVHIRRGDMPQARALAHTIIENFFKTWRYEGMPATAAHEKIIGQYLDANRFDEADAFLAEARKLDPDSATAFDQVAQRIAWKRQAVEAATRPSTRPSATRPAAAPGPAK